MAFSDTIPYILYRLEKWYLSKYMETASKISSSTKLGKTDFEELLPYVNPFSVRRANNYPFLRDVIIESKVEPENPFAFDEDDDSIKNYKQLKKVLKGINKFTARIRAKANRFYDRDLEEREIDKEFYIAYEKPCNFYRIHRGLMDSLYILSMQEESYHKNAFYYMNDGEKNALEIAKRVLPRLYKKMFNG